VGQVLFGDTTSMTGDGPLGYYLHNVYGTKWFSADTEMESGCGIAPITYRNKSLVHAWQWAIGLEWYLPCRSLARGHEHRPSEWRLVSRLSSNHPAADGSLVPQEILNTVHPTVREKSTTRATRPRIHPERNLHHYSCRTSSLLGLPTRDTLGPGPMPT
jgi:hypothetical protein